MPPSLTAIACVIGLAAGQLLFKASANQMGQGGPLDPRALGYLAVAMLLYGVTSVAWVWLLKTVELGKIYPFMALAFVLVPLGSYLVYGETFAPRYFAGVALIISGLLLTTYQG